MKRACEAFIWLLLIWLVTLSLLATYKVVTILGSRKDFWDVLTAIGTCAAALVALWLGLRQETIRRQEAANRAALVSARLVPRLGASFDMLRALATMLDDFNLFQRKVGDGADAWERMRRTMSRSMLQLETDDITALSALPRNAGVRLARTIALLELVDTRMSRWDAGRWAYEVEDSTRHDVARSWLVWIAEATALLEVVVAECISASHKLSAHAAEEHDER